MNEEEAIERVNILLEQSRYKEALHILTGLLAANPNNPFMHAAYADIMLMLDKPAEAEVAINTAIGIAPDEASFFFDKARIMLALNNNNKAEENLRKAIAINPAEPPYYAFLASVKLARKDYEAALDLANEALKLDPENLFALNTRSRTLQKLNRKEEAQVTIEGALREDPNNAYTHANYGWNLLEQGKHQQALEHFREALQIDPNFEFAQAGMSEALKARYFIFRMFQRYAFWMSKLTGRSQWGVIIGAYLAIHGLERLANSNETAQLFLYPVIAILLLFAFSTWIIQPVSNLFLRLNPYGKHLLDSEEKISSNFVAASAALALVGAFSFWVSLDLRWLLATGFCVIMMIPFSAMFTPARFKHIFLVYTICMGILAILSVVLSFAGGNVINMFSVFFFFGFVAFQWLANFFIIRYDNR